MKINLNEIQASLLSLFLTVLLIISSSFRLICGEDAPAVELNRKVRTEGLTGLNRFLAQTYNDDRLLFAVISTASIVLLGIIVTYIIGFFIKPHVYNDKTE